MNKQPIIGYGSEALATGMSLMTAAKLVNAKMTPEEREANKQRYISLKEERIRRSKIIQNICPSCEGKLVRGKKNKQNDYKREWTCSECEDVHSI